MEYFRSMSQCMVSYRLALKHGHWWAGVVCDTDDEIGVLTEKGRLRSVLDEAARKAEEDGFWTGIWPSPAHTTGSGRLRWSVAEDGTATLEVWRPRPRHEPVLRAIVPPKGRVRLSGALHAAEHRHWIVLRDAMEAVRHGSSEGVLPKKVVEQDRKDYATWTKGKVEELDRRTGELLSLVGPLDAKKAERVAELIGALEYSRRDTLETAQRSHDNDAWSLALDATKRSYEAEQRFDPEVLRSTLAEGAAMAEPGSSDQIYWDGLSQRFGSQAGRWRVDHDLGSVVCTPSSS